VGVFAEIYRLPKFEKDIGRLHKRFATIEDDLRIFNEDKIDLIEIYYKGDKANEDKRRILEYLSQNP